MGSPSNSRRAQSITELIEAQNKAYLSSGVAAIKRQALHFEPDLPFPRHPFIEEAFSFSPQYAGSARVFGGKMIAFDVLNLTGAELSLPDLTAAHMMALESLLSAGGAIVFLIAAFTRFDQYFLLPFDWIFGRWQDWIAGRTQVAVLTLEELSESALTIPREGRRLDYLDALIRMV
jgi:penicillin-binding protein-related factor A (putative recombinase)